MLKKLFIILFVSTIFNFAYAESLAPDTPQNIKIMGKATGTVSPTVSWDYVPDVAYYAVAISTNDFIPDVVDWTYLPASTVSHTYLSVSLSQNSPYSFLVKAVDKDGNQSAVGSSSFWVVYSPPAN